MTLDRICSHENCERRHYALGWCRLHYRRVKEHGVPDPARKTEAQRFWEKVDKTGDCWLWTGAAGFQGYGSFNVGDGKWVSPHRYSYIERYGPIEPKMHLDHRCRQPLCVNPEHLRVTTCKENLEHRDLNRNNKSGYRDVHWDKKSQKWVVTIKHNRRSRYIGAFADVQDANNAAIQARNELFTHNDLDRAS